MNRWQFARTDCACLRHGRFDVRVSDAHLRRVVNYGMDCANCKLPGYVRILPLRVEAPTFFDARAVAQSVFHTTALVYGNWAGKPDVVVRWEGTDAGSRQDRRKVVEWRK